MLLTTDVELLKVEFEVELLVLMVTFKVELLSFVEFKVIVVLESAVVFVLVVFY